MTFCFLLASGLGTRLNINNIPKQFLELDSIPIVIHSLNKFLINEIDFIIITCNREWIIPLKNYLNLYYRKYLNKIFIIEGSLDSRNNSIINAINFIVNKFDNINDNDIILIHDSVRIFVSNKTIINNIEECKKNDVVTTIKNNYDTVFEVENNRVINHLNRDNIYFIETPQTFKYKILKRIYLENDFEIIKFTDSCGLCMKYNYSINLVKSDSINLKITDEQTFELAKFIYFYKKIKN